MDTGCPGAEGTTCLVRKAGDERSHGRRGEEPLPRRDGGEKDLRSGEPGSPKEGWCAEENLQPPTKKSRTSKTSKELQREGPTSLQGGNLEPFTIESQEEMVLISIREEKGKVHRKRGKPTGP